MPELSNKKEKLLYLVDCLTSSKINEDTIEFKKLEFGDNICNFILEKYKQKGNKTKRWFELFIKVFEDEYIETKNIKEVIHNYVKIHDIPEEVFLWLLEDNVKKAAKYEEIQFDNKHEQDIDEENEDDIDEEELYVYDSDIFKETKTDFTFRPNQELAIKSTIEQKYVSGIHQHIMGAGKTNIMFNIIENHNNTYIKKGIYIICCDRKEVIDKMFFTEDKYGEKIIDQEKVEFLDKNNIINLNRFEIRDYVNNKPKRLDITVTNKSVIMVINNRFLDMKYKYQKDDFNRVKLVLFDECHAVSGENFYKALNFIKYDKNISIIGFSATPLREKAEKKLVDIFSKTHDKDEKNKTLNIISQYLYTDALKDSIVLPFKYHYVEIMKKKDTKDTIDIKLRNERIAKKTLDDIFPKLPYKKIIAWTRNIDDLQQWYIFFKKYYNDYKIYTSCCRNKEIDNEWTFTSINNFYKEKDKAIMLCINRFREGSDIPYVDCGIYLDAVKKRSILVSLQSSGRICRPDADGKKTHAVIIDMFVSDETNTVEILTFRKLLDYYTSVNNLTHETDGFEDIKKLYKLIDKIKVDQDKNEIRIPITNNSKHDNIIKYSLIQKEMDWGVIIDNLKSEINKKILKHVDNDEIKKLKIEYSYCVDKNKKFRITDKKMYNRYMKYYKLIPEPEIYFKSIWKNWYEYLGIDTSDYPSFKDWCKIIKKLKISSVEEYENYCEEENLPEMPEEYYKEFTNWEKYFYNDYWQQIY